MMTTSQINYLLDFFEQCVLVNQMAEQLEAAIEAEDAKTANALVRPYEIAKEQLQEYYNDAAANGVRDHLLDKILQEYTPHLVMDTT